MAEVMVLKQRTRGLLPALALPLAVGGLSAWLTRDGMAQFEQLNKPPLSPPGWLFPAVWTALYLLMGLASFTVCAVGKGSRDGRRALLLYGLQLVFNFLWSIWFFGQGRYLFSFFWLLALWVLIGLTALAFARVRPFAGWLLTPYLVWVSFAGYLNLAIYFLNRPL